MGRGIVECDAGSASPKSPVVSLVSNNPSPLEVGRFKKESFLDLLTGSRGRIHYGTARSVFRTGVGRVASSSIASCICTFETLAPKVKLRSGRLPSMKPLRYAMGTKQRKLVKQSKCLPTFKLSIAVCEFLPQYLGAQGNWLSY